MSRTDEIDVQEEKVGPSKNMNIPFINFLFLSGSILSRASARSHRRSDPVSLFRVCGGGFSWRSGGEDPRGLVQGIFSTYA